MDCANAQERLSPLIDDALPPEEADAVRGHLLFCSGCKKAHEALREVGRRIRALGAAPLPAGFMDRLSRRRAGAPAAAAAGPAPLWLKLAPVAAAAALVVIVGLSNRRARPTTTELADDELRVALKRSPPLEPPAPAAAPKRRPAEAFSNESQAEFLAQQRDELGIKAVGAQRADEESPPPSMFGGSISDPERRPLVEATMRRMAALSRAIRERSGPPEVPIAGRTAPVLGKADDAAGAAYVPDAPLDRWSGRHGSDFEGPRTIYDAGEWRKVWKAISPEPLPPVDFTKTQVVAVFLGHRPTGGYAAQIVEAVFTPTAVIVQWQERAPDPGVPGPEGATSPWAMRAIPRSDLPVRYQKLP